MTRRRRTGRRGYILVMTCLSLIFLLGVAGLAVDIGRMYITKNECQAYVDSAAINAATKLDGTSTGITNATNSTGGDTGKWRFDTQSFSSVTMSFANSANGTYTTSPASATGYNYVKVTATVNLPMYLIRPLSGPTASIGATAVAFTANLTTLPSGVFPFSPYTRSATYGATPDNANDPYGYQVGNSYTLRWGAPGNVSSCGTDGNPADTNLSTNGSFRGYCCAYGNGASDVRSAIIGANTQSVTIGSAVPTIPGAKNTEGTAIADRVNLDTDTTSSTYADYVASGTGNGERVVVVVVNEGGNTNYIAQGFAAFFLSTPDTYNGVNGNQSMCAQYIGAWTEGGSPFGASAPPGPTASGGFRIRLAR